MPRDANSTDPAARRQTTTASATFEVYADTAGDWRFRRLHDDGNVLADGGQG